MSRSASILLCPRPAVVALILAACVLAGCGRKGPLDLPPGAAATDQNTVAVDPNDPNRQQSANPTLFGSSGGGGRNQAIVAPRGPKKRIPLDALLD